jgi:hypothetical protein
MDRASRLVREWAFQMTAGKRKTPSRVGNPVRRADPARGAGPGNGHSTKARVSAPSLHRPSWLGVLGVQRLRGTTLYLGPDRFAERPSGGVSAIELFRAFNERHLEAKAKNSSVMPMPMSRLMAKITVGLHLVGHYGSAPELVCVTGCCHVRLRRGIRDRVI